MLDRRRFLQQFAAVSAAGMTGLSTNAYAASESIIDSGPDRTLNLYNIHTGETVKSTFWSQGQFIDSEIEMIDMLVRDFRANDVISMDRKLYQDLYELQTRLSPNKPMYIISGYRSPKTNAALRNGSSGVAKKSLHMQGRAIDLRIPGVSHKELHRAALELRSGGVGYYPKSGFVHLDTGRVRRWQG